MNQEFFTLNSQDLETLITKSNCACHIINPNKTRILQWKETKDNQTVYYLKIGIQKFSSQEQIDRNGEIYWRYWTYEPKKEEVNVKTQALNHGQSNSTVNSSEQSEPTSH